MPTRSLASLRMTRGRFGRALQTYTMTTESGPPATSGRAPGPRRQPRAGRMKLATLVDTSRRVAESRGRRDKIALLAALLAAAPPDEVALATAYLYGAVPQQKLGIGWASLQAAATVAPAASPQVDLAEV